MPNFTICYGRWVLIFQFFLQKYRAKLFVSLAESIILIWQFLVCCIFFLTFVRRCFKNCGELAWVCFVFRSTPDSLSYSGDDGCVLCSGEFLIKVLIDFSTFFYKTLVPVDFEALWTTCWDYFLFGGCPPCPHRRKRLVQIWFTSLGSKLQLKRFSGHKDVHQLSRTWSPKGLITLAWKRTKLFELCFIH